MAKVICSFRRALDDVDVQADIAIKENMKRMSLQTFHANEIIDIDSKEIMKFQKDNLEFTIYDSKIGYEKLSDNLEEVENIFRALKEIKIKFVSVYGYFKDLIPNKEAVFARFLVLADLAKKYGLILLIRNNALTYLDKADTLMELLNEIDKPNVKILFDTKEFMSTKEILLPAYRFVKKEVAFVYLDDSINGISVPIGCGDAKITDFISVLEKDEYDGYYIVNLDFSEYLNRDVLYKKAKFNPFIRFSKEYKTIKSVDEKLGKEPKNEVTPRYLAALQLRFIKKIIEL